MDRSAIKIQPPVTQCFLVCTSLIEDQEYNPFDSHHSLLLYIRLISVGCGDPPGSTAVSISAAHRGKRTGAPCLTASLHRSATMELLTESSTVTLGGRPRVVSTNWSTSNR